MRDIYFNIKSHSGPAVLKTGRWLRVCSIWGDQHGECHGYAAGHFTRTLGMTSLPLIATVRQRMPSCGEKAEMNAGK